MGRRTAWLAVLAVTAAGALATWAEGDAGGPRGGPVVFGSDGVRGRAGVLARAGDRAVFGATTVHNEGDTEVTRRDAHLLGDVDPTSARVTEVRVVDLGESPGTGDLLGAGEWPVRDYLAWWREATPIAGAELAAGHAAELVFMVTVDETGLWHWPRTSVDYDAHGVRYTAVTDFGFGVCPPAPSGWCADLLGGD